MRPSDGYVDEGKEDHVSLLKKSLYGLKQSPWQWYKWFDKYMIENGFSRSEYDSCVYMREVKDGSLLYLFLYVNDMLVIAKDMFEVKKE